jgi:TonB family protein
LKLVASDPGRVFDPNLAEEMTPKIEITVSSIPAVRQKEARVKGALDRDIIRRIVRAHINEIRYCYNQGLARDPNLDGTVTVDFQILGDGKVGDGKVGKSTMPDAAVGECMVLAVKRWSFPKPVNEGTVEVSYPFELSSDGARAERR